MEKEFSLSIEQMNHLESLGLDTSNASMMWLITDSSQYLVPNTNEYKTSICGFLIADKCIPAYILQDILKILFNIPEKECGIDEYSIYLCDLEDNIEKEILCQNKSLLTVAYEMLVYCLENKYIKTNE